MRSWGFAPPSRGHPPTLACPPLPLPLQARLDAKIDSKAGTVVMGTQAQSIQDQLIEKAKGLSVRTFVLANAVVGGGARS
jgi:hypothetical protein